MQFYAHDFLGQKVTVFALKSVLYELVRLLVETKLESCPNGQTYVKVVNVHCVKLIERSDHTNIIW